MALSTFLDLPYTSCVIAVFVIVTLYTLVGGFESVVLTDAVQGVLMLAGALAIGIGLVVAGGGLGKIWAELAATSSIAVLERPSTPMSILSLWMT